jgi:hypothetical protein
MFELLPKMARVDAEMRKNNMIADAFGVLLASRRLLR